VPTTPCLLWLRQDLRLRDHPALTAAYRRGGAVIPVFIHPATAKGEWPRGAADRYALHQVLQSHRDALRRRGSDLILRRGEPAEVLLQLVAETGAGAVYWTRRYEPASVALDDRLGRRLQDEGTEVRTFGGRLLLEPGEITTRTGGPYQVFTPFYREALRRLRPSKPLPAPRRLRPPRRWPRSDHLEALRLEPRIDWAGGIRTSWTWGEEAAHRRLRRFIRRALADYETARDRPDREGTSRLSPHLHHGEISPRQVWRAVASAQALGSTRELDSAQGYLRQLIWREFAYHLLVHFPHTPEKPLRPQFGRLRWRRARGALRSWQRGATGYPIVDAGMRQLWETGWMHNRVRMIVASFLVKDLLLPWQEGARWFWDTLVDADLANNTFGWQWVAGCGADAAPFFRIFNPVLQGRKFDPQGDYVRRFVPELADLAARWIHAPWQAPASVRDAAGVILDQTYPRPIVDHAVARKRALEALSRVTR